MEVILVAARHTHVVWFGEMPRFLGLSYQVILPSTRRRILLANCPHEAKCVNSQVSPCNAVPSRLSGVSAQADFVECCSPGDGVVKPTVSWSDG